MERALARRDPRWPDGYAQRVGGSPHAEKVITEEGPLTSHEVFGTVAAPSIVAVFLSSSSCLQWEGLGTVRIPRRDGRPPKSGRGGRTGHTEQEAAHRGQDSSRWQRLRKETSSRAAPAGLRAVPAPARHGPAPTVPGSPLPAARTLLHGSCRRVPLQDPPRPPARLLLKLGAPTPQPGHEAG